MWVVPDMTTPPRGLLNPEDIAARLSLLEEGAVVMATMARNSRPAREAKVIAEGILREAEAGRTLA